MKLKILKTTLLLVAFTFLNCSNNGEDPEAQLPPITQTGANTFGAIVEGSVFIPENSFSTSPGNNEFKGLQVLVGENFATSNGNDKWTLLTGNFKINPSIYIFIYIPTLINKADNYIINESDGFENSNLPHPHIYCHINGNKNTYLSYENSGIIKFSRLDIASGIYSGAFSVKLKNKDNKNNSIEIIEGRFDINLNTVNK